MPRLLPATGLLALSALLLAGPTMAQGPALAAQAAAPANPPSASAFEGYRRFDAQPVAPWRESNDTVGRIGGWKVYAREAQQPDPTPARAAPAAPAARSEASPAPGAPAPAGGARGHAH